MWKRQATVQNETGLHARPASDFVIKAKEFQSDVTIQNMDSGNPPVNAKSILRLLGAGIACGTRVEIAAQGEDAEVAVAALAALIESGFGEEK